MGRNKNDSHCILMKSIESIKNFGDKRVFVRVDWNVPVTKDGEVVDDSRIQVSIPTIQYIKEHSGLPIIFFHFGRAGESARKVIEYAKKKFIVLSDGVEILDNLRLNPGEEANNEEFAKELASKAEIYVNDAFSAYRPHASIVLVPKFLPHYAGFRFLEEYKTLMGGAMPTESELLSFRDQTIKVADIRKEYPLETTKRDFIRANMGKALSSDLLSSAANAWLVKSYDNQTGFLKNMLPIYLGIVKYGLDGECNRDSEDNAKSSDLLMDSASNNIIRDVSENFKDREVVIELGAGSGNFSKKFLSAFPGSKAMVTDINVKTQETARENLTEGGFVEGENFELKVLDMKDIEGLSEIAKSLQGKKVFLHIGYILHEERGLAQDTLKALSEVFKGVDIVFGFSEYYLQDEITEEIPLHFQGLHYVTQDLFYREELFDEIAKSELGFEICKDQEGNPIETVHNLRNKINERGETEKIIFNSTTYWRLS